MKTEDIEWFIVEAPNIGNELLKLRLVAEYAVGMIEAKSAIEYEVAVKSLKEALLALVGNEMTPEALGRAVHETHRGWLVGKAWANHVFRRHDGGLFGYCEVEGCYQTDAFHSDDMADWGALPDERRAYFQALGEAGYAFRQAEEEHELAGMDDLPC